MRILTDQLQNREIQQRKRSLHLRDGRMDFYSNDYLGLAKHRFSADLLFDVGSTGSRLVSGHHSIHDETEKNVATFHSSEAAILFSSGYAANVGLLSSFSSHPFKIFYDEFSHASIRDGITLSKCRSQPYRHFNVEHLKSRLQKCDGSQVIVVTESVDSMSGEIAPLIELARVCEHHGAWLIVDEAHSAGLFGNFGAGIVQEFGLTSKVFARIVTYGKAFGCFGASVLCSNTLKDYLVNFARSFVYSTALPPISVAIIQHAYSSMETSGIQARSELQDICRYFRTKASNASFNTCIGLTPSPIQTINLPQHILLPLERTLTKQGFMIKAMLSPTVKQGTERLRITLHAYNEKSELDNLFQTIEENL